jgi:hypothetical protein
MKNNRCLRRSGLLCLGLLTLMVLAAFAPSAGACQTPVFRYALEKWHGDPYMLLIYHNAPLSPNERAIVDWLEEFQESEGSQMSVYVFDMSKPTTTQPATTQPTTQPAQTRAEAQRAYMLKKFPPPEGIASTSMVLRYPAQRGAQGAVWPVVYTGRLDLKVARAIIDSPARQAVAKRLLGGDSTVWVMLDSGDRAKDDAAAKMLETELARMNDELELPEQAPASDVGPYEDEIDLELKLKFTMFRVSRTDPAEAMFVKMLLCSEEDLDKEKDPMVFPIFGRGRALTALVGEGINTENIEDASIFLVGKCSCQVKNLNPGTDIMFSVNWDAALRGQPMMTMPPLPKLAAPPVAEARRARNFLPAIVTFALVAFAVVVGLPMARVMRNGAAN